MSTPTKTMQGLQLVKYSNNPQESLVYNESIPIPQITHPQQVLVKIHAAGVNPIEAKAASGNMRIATVIMTLPCVLGADFAGTIEAIGKDVKDFAVGDEVFGQLHLPFSIQGTFAQYTVVDLDKAAIAKKPAHVSFEQAASAGIAALTAYQGIVKNGAIYKDPNQKRKILVTGASGGVGSYGIQIAKAIHSDNQVIAICSGKNAAYVNSLGADRIIDYKDEDAYTQFIKEERGSFDIVFDCVGGEKYYAELDPLLKKGGVYSTAVGPVEHIGSTNVSVLTAVTLASKIICKKLFAAHPYAMITELPHAEFRTKVAPLFESKAIHGTVHEQDNVIPLKEGHKAFEKLMSHRTVGKIVFRID
jgi:NADPH:quinone reductase-like Zn-dependent oxidoreductase